MRLSVKIAKFEFKVTVYTMGKHPFETLEHLKIFNNDVFCATREIIIKKNAEAKQSMEFVALG